MPFKTHPFRYQPILPTYLLSSFLHFFHAGIKLIQLLITPNFYSLDLLAYTIVLKSVVSQENPVQILPLQETLP